MEIYFGLSSESTYDKKIEDLATNIGFLCYVTGTRPSALFEWNDPAEWEQRLMFDLDISSMVFKVLMEMKLV
jgi:hypothetical protein